MCVLSFADRTQRTVLTGHSHWVENCAFSPDGTLLATAGRDQTGLCWHPGAGLLCATGGAGVYMLTCVP
ncbi:hypothetical protein [Streptomyces canus]|uniref:hypothetical protein n=1 Tax=Streptomyces canus TaxID=58343 RepID=UPI003AF38EA1